MPAPSGNVGYTRIRTLIMQLITNLMYLGTVCKDLMQLQIIILSNVVSYWLNGIVWLSNALRYVSHKIKSIMIPIFVYATTVINFIKIGKLLHRLIDKKMSRKELRSTKDFVLSSWFKKYFLIPVLKKDFSHRCFFNHLIIYTFIRTL